MKVKKHAWLSVMTHCNWLLKQMNLQRECMGELGKDERVRGYTKAFGGDRHVHYLHCGDVLHSYICINKMYQFLFFKWV